MTWPGVAWIPRGALPRDAKGAASAPSPTVTALCFACLALVVFLRRPDSLLNPQLWAEDGSVFLKQAWDHGFLWTLAEPFSGYLHTFPRLAAGISLLAPLERAPLVFNSLAFLAQIAPLHYLLSDRARSIIPSFPARLLAAFLLAAAPNSYASHVNITNSQWNLALAAVLIVLSRAPAHRFAMAFDLALLVLFSLTGPFSVMLLPLLPFLLRHWAEVAGSWRRTLATIIALGAVVQLLFVLGSARTEGLGAASPPSPRETLTILSLHVFYVSVLGIRGATRLLGWLTWPAIIFGLLVVAGLAFLALRRMVPALCVLLYLATVTIVFSFLFPLNDLRLWLQPSFGPRYYYFATLFVIFSALHAAAREGIVRYAGMAVMGAVLLVAVPSDFFHPRLADTHFSDQVAVFNSLPQGTDFFIPLNPTVAFTGMTMRKKTAVRGPSPLSKLKSLPSAARLSVDPVSGFSLRPGVDFVRFSGWAIDEAAGKPAGGVYLRVDGRLFPAVCGERRPEFGNPGLDRALLYSGFVRYFPVSEIGRGQHSAMLIVLAADGRSYFHPSGAVPISIP
jgi:hypothetical protein